MSRAVELPREDREDLQDLADSDLPAADLAEKLLTIADETED
jgi:hypothetical protein